MSIQQQNSLMIDAFTGTYIIRASAEAWGFPPTGWDFEGIPIFYALDSSGNPTGRSIDGNAWTENDTPESIALFLKDFFDNIKE